MRSRPAVDVVLPCLNEIEALPWVLARIPPGMSALVVDNGSTDGSTELAVRMGARSSTRSSGATARRARPDCRRRRRPSSS